MGGKRPIFSRPMRGGRGHLFYKISHGRNPLIWETAEADDGGAIPCNHDTTSHSSQPMETGVGGEIDHSTAHLLQRQWCLQDAFPSRHREIMIEL